MVCPRCIEAVQNILESENIEIESIELGKANITDGLSHDKIELISKRLKDKGFELLTDKNQKIVDEIKSIIITLIHHTEEIPEHLSFSDVLSQKLDTDYRHLSTLFSNIEEITIEKYVILQKIEKAKELISYGNLNLSEIAFRMGYSNVSHLSAQFKQHTGLTPSQYAKLDEKKRSTLDNIIRKI
jgi:AraC family transcriptional regulator